MAHYQATIRVPVPIQTAFDYLADFSHTAEWDPGIVEAETLTPGQIGKGSRFRVVSSFLGRRVELEYVVTEFEPPRRVVLEGDADRVRSVDVIQFQPAGTGTEIEYDADLTLKGLLRAADPLLFVAFRWVANDAVAGLKKTLSRKGKRTGHATR